MQWLHDFRKSTEIVENMKEDEEDEDTFTVKNIEKINLPDKHIDFFCQFVECGAHKFNNAILGAVNGMMFFTQANTFCH